jgi:hypothetical protein
MVRMAAPMRPCSADRLAELYELESVRFHLLDLAQTGDEAEPMAGWALHDLQKLELEP